MDFVTSALILSWVAIALLGLVVARLVRQVHELQQGGAARQPRRLGLAAGEPAPGLGALDPTPGSAVLLLFLSVGCRTCQEVLAEAVQQTGLEIRVLYAGDAPVGTIEAGGVTIAAYGGQAELFERYDAVATPFAVVVDETGRVARSEPLGSREATRRLLDSLAAHERSPR
ncbi:hypothetical protein [Flindersiella endophytica]